MSPVVFPPSAAVVPCPAPEARPGAGSEPLEHPGPGGCRVRCPSPSDAQRLPALFHRVYGAHYPNPVYYQPDALLSAIAAGDMASLVAVAPDGTIACHLALFRPAPGPGLFELGAGLTHPNWRGQGLMALLTRMLLDDVAPMLGAETLMSEAVATHVITQDLQRREAFTVTALAPDLMPARPDRVGAPVPLVAPGDSGDTANHATDGPAPRVTTVLAFRPRTRQRADVFVPPALTDMLAPLLTAYPAPRLPTCPCRGLPSAAVGTRAQVTPMAGAGLTRWAITAAGADFAAWVDAHMHQAQAADQAVIQAFVSLTDPAVAAATDLLTARGFYCCGWAPAWLGSDAVVMQWSRDRPDFSAISVLEGAAQTLLAQVRAGYDAARP